MTPEREQELRLQIADMLCPGCARRDPLDERGRHVHAYKQEAFGEVWDSKTWFACTAMSPLIDQWFNFVVRVLQEEKPVKSVRKSRKRGIE